MVIETYLDQRREINWTKFVCELIYLVYCKVGAWVEGFRDIGGKHFKKTKIPWVLENISKTMGFSFSSALISIKRGTNSLAWNQGLDLK